LNVITVPPVVYPEEDSSVMFAVAVGALVPRRSLTPVVDAVEDWRSTAFRMAEAWV
jgi:hypothetical protein